MGVAESILENTDLRQKNQRIFSGAGPIERGENPLLCSRL